MRPGGYFPEANQQTLGDSVLKGQVKVGHPFPFHDLPFTDDAGGQDHRLGPELQSQHHAQSERAIVPGPVTHLAQEDEGFLDDLDLTGEVGVSGEVQAAVIPQGGIASRWPRWSAGSGGRREASAPPL